MIATRCPACATTFRVTPEQLKARGGKVRCGKCQTVFDAFATLLEAAVVPSQPPVPGPQPVVAVESPTTAPVALDFVLPDATPPAVAEPPAQVAASAPVEPAPAVSSLAGEGVDILLESVTPPTNVMHEAQAAGLVAARETREVPGYSKWAEQTIAGGDAEFAAPPRRPRWPGVVAIVLLTLVLALQAIHQFRGELAMRWPATTPWLKQACAVVGCKLPLPRQPDLISIEGSELQADAARGGLLALQATLKNRAGFAQALPALELTLTDAQDRLVARRVLPPTEYLPGAAADTSFAANADLVVKLWLDAKGAGAAGYRLYVFYP